MTLTVDAKKKISDYLEAVASNLTTHSDSEKEEILQNLEAHIHDALDSRPETEKTPGIVEAVLAEMDTPESYSSDPDLPPPITPPVDPADVRISKTAVAGLLCIVFSFAALVPSIMVATPTPMIQDGAAVEPDIGAMAWIGPVIMILGVIAVPLSVGFGFMAISQIRGARGYLTGLPLAVLDLLFYPLLLLTWIPISIVLQIGFVAWVNLVCILAILGLNVWIIRATWRSASRPPNPAA